VQYAVAKLGVPEVHRTNRGEGILVAVIDSGVDAGHPALKGAVLEEFEAVETKKGATDTHGTAVASIIAAREGMTGVAPQAMLLSIKAFAPDGKYGRTLGNTYDLLRGIDWAVKKNAKVLNLSFAGPRDPLLQSALHAAAERGVVLVGAAGNKGPKAPPAYPGAYEQVIAATATDAKDRLYKQANRGDYVAIAAPGVDILAAAGKKGYGVTSGTSMAAAYVSGSVALIMQGSPEMTSQDALDRIAGTAQDLGEDGKDPAFGHGLLNVYRALGGDQVTAGQANQKDPAN
jgi:subtilisin family serine protease